MTALAAGLVLAAVAASSTSHAQSFQQTAAASPAISFGSPAKLPTAEEQTARTTIADDSTYGLDPVVEHLLVGTALVGGAFTIGFAATGSLSTAMMAASAVVISYAVLP